MSFELQHSDIPQAKLLDEEVATTQWPMPPANPWAPKSSIEQMCEEARARLSRALDDDVFRHWSDHHWDMINKFPRSSEMRAAVAWWRGSAL